VTTLDMLQDFKSELDAAGIGLSFAKLSTPARELFRISGFLGKIGEDRIFHGVKNAVNALRADSGTGV
jgi:hypothetical protein